MTPDNFLTSREKVKQQKGNIYFFHDEYLNNPEKARLDLLTYIEGIKASCRNAISIQILTILAFEAYNILSKKESLLNMNDLKELEICFQTNDDIELEIKYFNWLFIKIANYRSNKILPQNDEYRSLTTSFYTVVGEKNFELAEELNEKYSKGNLALEELKKAFETLAHFQPQGWEILPNEMTAFSCLFRLKNPNYKVDV